jgi:hypothetical protein
VNQAVGNGLGTLVSTLSREGDDFLAATTDRLQSQSFARAHCSEASAPYRAIYQVTVEFQEA